MCATICAGCASLQFRVIDSESGTPIAGVVLYHISENPYWIDYAPYGKYYVPTGPDGRVTTDWFRADFRNIFKFERRGYISTDVYPDMNGTVSIRPWDIPVSESIVKRSDGLIDVPMHRAWDWQPTTMPN
jgi:hypothetical protein